MAAHIEVPSMVVRVLLCLSLMACGDEAYAQHLGGDSGIHGSTGGGGSGAAADPTPVYDTFSGGSGFSNMTAGAFTMTRVIDCDATDATTTNFPCDTSGTWTEADGDVTVGYAAPLTDTTQRAADYDRFYSHEAPNTTVGEVASGTDVRMGILAFVTDRGATQYLLSKYDTANSQGVANATAFGSHQIDAFGEWNFYELICSVDTCSLYVNGYLSGSTGARSGTLATVTAAKNFAVGCRPNGTNHDCIDGKVARFYVDTFPDSRVEAIHYAPADYPAGK